MNEEAIRRALPLVFREVKIPERAKSELRQRLFGGNQLSDDDLSLVAAAGDPAEQAAKNNTKNEGE
jgi:hypothetical protein